MHEKKKSKTFPDINEQVVKAVGRVLPLEVKGYNPIGEELDLGHAEIVAEDLKQIIEQLGLKEDEVLFSGFPTQEPSYDAKSGVDNSDYPEALTYGHGDAQKWMAKSKTQYARAYNAELKKKKAGESFDQSVLDTALKKHRLASERLDEIRNSSEEYGVYFFGDFDSISDFEHYGIGGVNPIGYSAYGGSIGIYSRDAINALAVKSTDEVEGGVVASQDEIESALILVYTPRFIEK